MLELLAPAGSMEAVTAAVQNGADAVYLGYGDFNARRNAKNFTREEVAAAVSYCHLRGCKVFLTLNTLLTDRELPAAAQVAAHASDIGVDAVLVQDLGVARMVRQTVPDLPIHASTQMTIHSLDGVKQCADLGNRLVVALNSDASVRRLKGPSRPVQDEQSRALVMAQLKGVDAVILFDEDTPLELIRALRPDVLVKGSDYNLQTVVGADEVLAYGGTVHLASLVDGCSTSGLVRRMGGPEKTQGTQGRAESRAG